MQANSVQEGGGSPDVIRHLVLLGDALENIELGAEPPEAVLVPRPRNPWKLTILEAPHVLARGFRCWGGRRLASCPSADPRPSSPRLARSPPRWSRFGHESSWVLSAAPT